MISEWRVTITGGFGCWLRLSMVANLAIAVTATLANASSWGIPPYTRETGVLTKNSQFALRF